MINEAAAAAHADPIQFRLQHTSDPRLIKILNATADAAGWESRPSPHPGARKTGKEPVTGRGVCIMVRANGYWVGIAEVAVTPATGVVQVTKFTLGVECGKIINPRQLDRCMHGGLVMGLGEALKEEVTFDKEKVTSTDWSRYQILTMARDAGDQSGPDIARRQRIWRRWRSSECGGPAGGSGRGFRCHGRRTAQDPTDPGICNQAAAGLTRESIALCRCSSTVAIWRHSSSLDPSGGGW